MAWTEHVETLKDIRCCFVCGESNEGLLNIDHRRPKSLIYVPKIGKSSVEIMAMKKAHPFYETVYDNSNLYSVDLKHHREADSEKIDRFLGAWKFRQWDDPETIQEYLESLHRGEPAALEQWLFRNYPWSRHPFYFEKQRRMNYRSNILFQQGVEKSEGYFPDFYVEKCRQAASLARQHNQQLHCMPSPSLKFIVDFGRQTQVTAVA